MKPAPQNKDRRSPQAEVYRQWYQTPDWRRARAACLAREPWCRECAQHGRKTRSTIAHHSRAHRGNWALFIDPSNHEGWCKNCHDTVAQQTERLGYSTKIGADGMPLDRNHPFYGG